MIDYSFLRLKSSITDALNTGNSPVATHLLYNSIQLLPNKSYLQITSVQGGISLTSDCRVYITDCAGTELSDITNHVFIEEFTDVNGNNQCAIELINLGIDLYGQSVLLKFDMNSGNAVYYSNPIRITSLDAEQTVFFKYKNYNDFNNIPYTNSQKWQSISVRMFFDIPIDESETQDYFQISKNNTISSRVLQKTFEKYQIQYIDTFTYLRLNTLLKHELIYLNDYRLTNKPIVSSNDREGDSNWFSSELMADINYNDYSPYELQNLTDGLQLFDFQPFGNYITNTQFDSFGFKTNLPITINSGTIRVYNSNDVLQHTFNENDLVLLPNNQIKLTVIGTPLSNLSNGTYYVHISGGIVSGLGIPNDAITDTTTWAFSLTNADFNGNDFNNNDFFTD